MTGIHPDSGWPIFFYFFFMQRPGITAISAKIFTKFRRCGRFAYLIYDRGVKSVRISNPDISFIKEFRNFFLIVFFILGVMTSLSYKFKFLSLRRIFLLRRKLNWIFGSFIVSCWFIHRRLELAKIGLKYFLKIRKTLGKSDNHDIWSIHNWGWNFWT